MDTGMRFVLLEMDSNPFSFPYKMMCPETNMFHKYERSLMSKLQTRGEERQNACYAPQLAKIQDEDY